MITSTDPRFQSLQDTYLLIPVVDLVHEVEQHIHDAGEELARLRLCILAVRENGCNKDK